MRKKYQNFSRQFSGIIFIELRW